MAKYRTKPCEIEAIQWTGNTKEVEMFCGNSCTYSVEDSAWKVGKGIPHEKLIIHTLEGDMVANRNDYIIKGLRGEFYPCKPDVFNKKYELLNWTLVYPYGFIVPEGYEYKVRIKWGDKIYEKR